MPEENNCIFCKIVKKEISTNIIYESENFICFPDKNQKVKGHSLIVPKKHFVNLMDMPSELGSELLFDIKEIAANEMKKGATGFNILQNNFSDAGQAINHAHIHIMPRYKNDGFKLCV